MSSKTRTAPAKAEGKPTLLPKLRFPEFRRAELWKDIPIASILKVRDERRIPTTEAPLFSLTIESGITEKTDRYNREFLVRDAGNKKYKLVEPNDIVYNPSNLRWGAINYSQLSHSVVVSPIYEVLSLGDHSEHFLEFIASAVMRDEQIRRFITKAQGTLVERIAVKIEDFVLTKLPVPPTRAEQQKIAECLISVDELMAAQARKLDALRTHKKGLMQQLFPREGETQPRLRFPEFQNAGEWEVRTIGEMFSLINGCAFKPEDWKPAGTPIIRIQNLNDPSAEFNYSQAPVPERNRVESGDLLFAWSGTLGSSFGARIWNGPSGVLNQHIFKVLMDEQQITLQFALLVLARVEEDIARRTHGFKASFVHVKKSDLVQVELLLPSVPEQQRIAACLSNLNALITAEAQKLDALKTHKQALMQQLFPSTKREV